MKIAALQMISGAEVAPNLVTAERLIAEAAAAGAELVALPEYFPMIGAGDAERQKICEPAGHGPLQNFLARMAKQHKLWLVGGSLPLQATHPSQTRNACLLFAPDGVCVARYNKMHLFGFRQGDEAYDESNYIEAGERVVIYDFQTGSTSLTKDKGRGIQATNGKSPKTGDEKSKAPPLRRIGLGICYDLRFPEFFRAMGEIDLLVLPAAFTETTGRDHWEILVRARAIENQCYVLAAAQGGQHPSGRVTHGNSMIVDPWGVVLARIDKGEGVIVAEFDRARLDDVRTRLPALRHRLL